MAVSIDSAWGAVRCPTILRVSPLISNPWNGAYSAARGIWQADSLRGRFARGAVWSLLGAAASQASSLAASVITARLLGREEFGKFGIVQSTVGMFGIFAGLGLGITAAKYVAEFRTRDPERAGRIIALGCAVAVGSGGLLTLALLICAPVLAADTLGAPDLALELRIASLLCFLNALNGAQMGALSGFEGFRTITRINVARGVVALPLTVVAVFLWRLPGAVWASVVVAAWGCLFTQVLLRKQCLAFGIHPRISSAWAERPILWRFSAPAFMSAALVGPVVWAANAMLVNQPGGYSEMGVFSAANQWRNAIGFVPGILAQFALPVLSNLNGEGEGLRYTKALRWNLLLSAGAAILVAAPVALFAPFIMRLYGRGFQHGSLILAVSAITAAIICTNGVIGTAIFSAGSVWIGLIFNAMWAAVFFGGCYFLIPTHLGLGLAVSMLIAYLAHTVWQGTYLCYHMSHSRIR